MGAEPAWALLSLSLPRPTKRWLERFAAGLYALAGAHGVALVGGDTVARPARRHDRVARIRAARAALRRSGARPGDLLYVSGCAGRGGGRARGAAARGRGELDRRIRCVRRFLLCRAAARARARAARPRDSAAMDVSDGLLGDLGKLCAASGVGRAARPRAPADLGRARAAPRSRADCERLVLHGGDDYELLFTVPPAARRSVEASWRPRDCDCRASHRRDRGGRGRALRARRRAGDRARRRL